MNALQSLGLVVSILAGIGAAAAFLSVGRQRGRLQALRDDVLDRDRRISFLEAENARHDQSEADQAQLILHLRDEIRVLRANWVGAEGPIGDIRRRVVKIDQGLGDVLKMLGKRDHEGDS